MRQPTEALNQRDKKMTTINENTDHDIDGVAQSAKQHTCESCLCILELEPDDIPFGPAYAYPKGGVEALNPAICCDRATLCRHCKEVVLGFGQRDMRRREEIERRIQLLDDTELRSARYIGLALGINELSRDVDQMAGVLALAVRMFNEMREA